MKTIKITELGNAVGTSKQVAEKLEHINNSLKVSVTKSGYPCISYEHWSNKDKQGKPKRYALMIYAPGFDGYERYNNMYESGFKEEGIYQVYPVAIYPESVELFPILSIKAHEIVVEYLAKVRKEFYEKYNEL